MSQFDLIPKAVLACCLSLFTLGCGAGSGGIPEILQPATGDVALLASDSPSCDAISFRVTITGASLTPASGGSPVALISSAAPVTVDFAALLDFKAPLTFAQVPPDTYSKFTVNFADPHLTVIDTTQSPPQPVEIPADMAPLSVTASLSPSLAVAANGSSALLLHFNLLKSLQTDAHGQLTGAVVPVVEAAAVTASLESGFGDLEDLKGIVQSVSETNANPAFTGSFTILPSLSNTGLLTINVTGTTKFDGVSGLGGLAAGRTFVEVDAFLDTSDNIVAREVEAESEESLAGNQAAFSGLITSLDRDASGNATQFQMFVRDEAPDLTALVPQGSLLLVKVAGATQFVITPDGVNQANLPFNAASLGPGQSVIVHGEAQAGTSPSVAAGAIFLRLQSVAGTLVPALPPVVGNDGKTGGFTLAPCSSLYAGAPVTVFTFASTDFSGVTGGGLSGLSAGPLWVVKGVTLFEQSPVFVNGLGLAPPSTAAQAKDIRELP